MFDVTITIPDMDQPTPEAAAHAARRFLGTEVMLHDLQFVAGGQAVTLKGHDIELPSMLVLSTSHLRQETAQLLEADEAGVIRHEKGEYGWIIPIIDNPSNEPPPNLTDLVGIYGFARSVGATWIMLDRDAEEVAGLETWEW